MGFIRFPGGGEATITPNQATGGGIPTWSSCFHFGLNRDSFARSEAVMSWKVSLRTSGSRTILQGVGGIMQGFRRQPDSGGRRDKGGGRGAIRSRESRHWREQPRGQAPAAGPTPQRQCQYPMDCRTALQPKRQAPGGHGLAGPSRATGWPCLSPYLWGVLPLVARERNAPRTLHCLLLGGVTRLKPNKPWKESLRFWRRFELLVGP